MRKKLENAWVEQEKREGFWIFSFSLIWLGLNYWQAIFTGLSFDESYYFLYGQHLDWMYFDHPPVLPLFVRLGSAISHSEWGVRFFIPLLSLISVVNIYFLSSRKYPLAFFLLISGTFLIHVGGWFAAPDVVLIFSASLFLHCIKRYIENDSLFLGVLMGVLTALLIYSKYHGILLIIFSVLAVPLFFRRLSFYVAIIVAIILLIPQIIWQFENDFPTVAYYFVERPSGDFNVWDCLSYLGGVFFLLGPFTGFISIPAAFMKKISGTMDRLLKVLMYGVFVFFFIFSLRGHIEPNWAALSFIPLLVFATDEIGRREWGKYLVLVSSTSFVVLFLIRLNLVFSLWSFEGDRMAEFKGWEPFIEEVKELAGERDLICHNYQYASKFSFYLDEEIPSLNIGNRRNQFSIWQWERKLDGKPVAYLTNRRKKNSIEIINPFGNSVFLSKSDRFVPMNYSQLSFVNQDLEGNAGDTLTFKVKLSNLPKSPLELNTMRPNITDIRGEIFDSNRKKWFYGTISNPICEDTEECEVVFVLPDSPGDYTIDLYFQTVGIGKWSTMGYQPLIVR